MKVSVSNYKLSIQHTETMGRGVFANKDFKKGDTLEICPIIFIGDLVDAHWIGTSLEDYVFEWNGNLAIALGYGSLYNHSSSPNAKHSRLIGEQCIHFTASRSIRKGDQIFINYGWKTDEYPFPKHV